MCYYITATLPKETKVEALRQILDKYEMAFQPLNNKSVKKQLRQSEQYFRATKSYCDCDNVLGSLSTNRRQASLMESKKVKNLRKKGWTEEEIEDWVKDKIAKKKIKVGRKLWPELIDTEATKWIEFIQELLHTKNISHIGLLKHWYTGGLESAEIEIKEKKKIDVQNINVELISHIDEDILYEFFSK